MDNLLEVRRLWGSLCHRALSFPITLRMYLKPCVFFPFVLCQARHHRSPRPRSSVLENSLGAQ